MANKKITDLVEITSAANVDVLPIVDVSADITNKIKVENLPISTATQTALDAKQATLVSGTNIKTINSTSLLGSGDISIAANPAGTAGQIQFSDGSAFAADSNLYWDNTNKRLGVGTSTPGFTFHSVGAARFQSLVLSAASATSISNTSQDVAININNQGVGIGSFTTFSPTARLHIKGSGSTAASTSLLVQNSSGAQLLQTRDDGYINIGVDNNIAVANYGDIFLKAGTTYFRNISGYYAAITQNGMQIGGGFQTPVASAQLELISTTKGFLPPRMTTTQKNAISTPAAGLQLYDSTTSRPCVYTSAWESLTSSDSASPTAVYKFWSGTAAQYAALTPDANTVYFVS